MGMYAEEYKAVSDYVLVYDELKKVLPEEIKLFEDKVDEVLVALKMMGYNQFDLNSILEYFVTEAGGSIDSSVSEDDLEAIDEKLDELYYLSEDVENKFKEKTGIEIKKAYNKVDDYFYYEMDFSDVVELTPQAKLLRESGVNFNLQTWVDEW